MKHRYLRNVSTLELNVEKCVGCKRCLDVCPHRVIESCCKKVKISDKDACMECGACALNCPVGAITVKPGVGCAIAIIRGMLTGTEPDCDCDC